jgi:hypothetical protein
MLSSYDTLPELWQFHRRVDSPLSLLIRAFVCLTS